MHMKPSYNSGDNATGRHPIPRSKTSTEGNELHLVELLTKGVPQTTPGPMVVRIRSYI